MTPRVSVIMPVFNAAPYVEGAARSILDQTFIDLELIAIDDASTDGSLDILRGIADERVMVIALPKNKGVAGCLNEGLAAASGDLIARMDADDISHLDRLDKQVHFLDTSDCISLVGGQIRLFNDDPRTASRTFSVPTWPNHVRWSLHFGNAIGHVTVMARRSLFESVGGYDERLTTAQDYDLWVRVKRDHQLANLSDDLVDVRILASGVSRSQTGLRLQNASATVRRALSDSLGRNIPAEVANLLFQPRLASTSSETLIQTTLDVLDELSDRLTSTGEVTREEKSLIHKDAAYRSTQLILKFTRKNRAAGLRLLRRSRVSFGQATTGAAGALFRRMTRFGRSSKR